MKFHLLRWYKEHFMRTSISTDIIENALRFYVGYSVYGRQIYFFVSPKFCAISFSELSMYEDFPLLRVWRCARAIHFLVVVHSATGLKGRIKDEKCMQPNIKVMLLRFSGILCCHLSSMALAPIRADGECAAHTCDKVSFWAQMPERTSKSYKSE